VIGCGDDGGGETMSNGTSATDPSPEGPVGSNTDPTDTSPDGHDGDQRRRDARHHRHVARGTVRTARLQRHDHGHRHDGGGVGLEHGRGPTDAR
jgi:hypothetical protein